MVKYSKLFLLCCAGYFVNTFSDTTIIWKNFDSAMSASFTYDNPSVKSNSYWQLTRSIFDRFIDNLSTQQIQIPKIIHQIWLGGPLPEKCKAFQKSWKLFNPDWTYILWTEKEIADFGLYNKIKFDAAISYGEKSDIARYEILYRMGGVYADSDFECLKSFDILHQSCSLYAGISHEPGYEIYNGLIGAAAGHPVLLACINKIHASPLVVDKDTMGILKRTGPYLFTECVQQFLNADKGIIIFPVNYFYPWSNRLLHISNLNEIYKLIKEESFAIHHWHRSWF